MVKIYNRAKMSTATTGTGTITLGSASTSFQSFADAGASDAEVIAYLVEDGTDWEVGTGTYTTSGTTLSRTVIESSNADSALNLSGSATVAIVFLADHVANQTESNTFTADQFIDNGVGLVVGHTAQVGFGEVTAEAQVLGTTETDANLGVALWSTTNTLAPTITLLKSGNATIGSNTTVADDEQIGQIVAYADDGTDFDTKVAAIEINVDDASVAAGQIGGEILLRTATSGGTLTTALTLDALQNLIIANSLYLDEQAAADASTAGRGQIWVANSSPCTLYFTDDAGNDYNITTGGGPAVGTDSVIRTNATNIIEDITVNEWETTFTSTNATNVANVGTDDGFANEDTVYLTTTAADLPNGWSINTTYYVIGVTASTLQLSLTNGGSAVTISDDGTGTHSIAKSMNGMSAGPITIESGHTVTVPHGSTWTVV